MMRGGCGRIVNLTTSLGTMLNAGSPTDGPSRAALDALSAIMSKYLDGTGVMVNVLVPGGLINTPTVSDEAGFDRAKMIRADVMAPTSRMAGLPRCREGDRSAVSRRRSGYQAAGGTSNREA
jgi:NAD(P)-dependent dehydrogenase (short-subunit alcohol dehydrogenase family)